MVLVGSISKPFNNGVFFVCLNPCILKWLIKIVTLKLRRWGSKHRWCALLCNSRDESRSHLFFNHPSSRSLIFPLAEMLYHSFWKLSNTLMLTLICPDIRLGISLMLARSSPITLLPSACSSLECSWHLTVLLGTEGQRNRRLKQHTMPPEVLLKEIIRDISLSYRSDCTLLENLLFTIGDIQGLTRITRSKRTLSFRA